jgi:predicted alpha/beta-hydrolase family hydrolase
MRMIIDVERIEDLSGEQPVRGYLHVASPSGDVLVLTHGAGANCNAPLLVKLADAFASAGINVLRCDLPFRQRRPHGPPLRTANEDQQGLRCAVEVMKKKFGESSPSSAAHKSGATDARVFLGGHSYGGRMASMLLADDPSVADALLLLSYPLHPPKKPEQKRTAHFPSLRTPTVFVHGSKDEFATKQELVEAMDLIPATTELIEMNGGHGLGTKEADLMRIVEGFGRFIAA